MLNIAVIGHVYNLYDSYINMELLDKLRNNGVNIITIDMIDEEIINEKCSTLPKRMFWNFGRKAIGSVMHILDRDDIDGVIYLMSFGCGIDSFICDLAERKVRRESNIPFIVLTIDEHSGEAGMNTRIEAFLDMIRWRHKDENNISAYG
jgi:predicted nucleotide-binding protein (sugar kinase/HSP70/actin superfamily)